MIKERASKKDKMANRSSTLNKKGHNTRLSDINNLSIDGTDSYVFSQASLHSSILDIDVDGIVEMESVSQISPLQPIQDSVVDSPTEHYIDRLVEGSRLRQDGIGSHSQAKSDPDSTPPTGSPDFLDSNSQDSILTRFPSPPDSVRLSTPFSEISSMMIFPPGNQSPPLNDDDMIDIIRVEKPEYNGDKEGNLLKKVFCCQ